MQDFLGESDIFISGHVFFSDRVEEAGKLFPFVRMDTLKALATLTGQKPRLRFGRMFSRPYLPEFRPEPDSLLALGMEMTTDESEADISSLPAGYTYLGQFIDHDITFDNTRGIPVILTPIEQIEQLRTPSLDLDSLYGAGSPLESDVADEARIYQDDGIHLRVGRTMADFVLTFSVYANDLPRARITEEKPYRPAIADPRNDENLVVAQTHLAFIKFHNEVVEHLKQDYSGVELLRAARETVVKHYQWIVLTDFLGRFVEHDVLRRVIDEGCKHFLPEAGNQPFMPFEFSGAAYRLGHSLIRESYEWNRFLQSPEFGGKLRRATLEDLHIFSTLHSTLGSNHCLPSTWIIDWTRFFDFGAIEGMETNPRLNFTKKINTLIARSLQVPRAALEPGITMAGPAVPRGMLPIAVLDLFRGSVLGVPAAQSVVERLRDGAASGQEIKSLTPDQIAGGSQKTLKDNGLHKTTPLWYYILREAEEFHQGERLGPVGSHIVAETFVGLIKASRISIFKEQDRQWPLDLRVGEGRRFGMPDMLHFVNDLNPLG